MNGALHSFFLIVEKDSSRSRDHSRFSFSFSLFTDLLNFLLPFPFSQWLLLPPINGSIMSSLVSEAKTPGRASLIIFTLRFVKRESTLSWTTSLGEENKYLQHSLPQSKIPEFPSSFSPRTMPLRVGVLMS